MKRKLVGHKMAPPAGLWEDISSEMGLSPMPTVTKSATTKHIRRWHWVAAAAVLALVGFFAFYHHNGNEPYLQVAVNSTPQSPEQITIVETSEQPELIVQTHRKNKVSLPADSADVQQTVDEPQSQDDSRIADSDTYGSRNANSLTGEAAEPSATKHENRLTSNLSPLPSHRNKWSVGLKASGGLLAANNTVGDAYVYQSYSNSGTHNGAIANSGNLTNIDGNGGSDYIDPQTYFGFNTYSHADYVWKHRLPVRFGLSLQYQLNESVSLLNGISYTRLSSEFSIPLYPNFSYDQHLHYVGIPLGVSWQLWANQRFSLYVSGGAMVEKCVSSTTSMKYEQSLEKPWQLSVSAAAGIEYTLAAHHSSRIPDLGIYLEPSLGYYFDDGCSLQHYYKEHPLAPAIEFGLRLHLNR